MINGSCLCGDVRFEIDEIGILLFNFCHCTRCQKRSGSAHTSQLQVAGKNFRWTTGQDKISIFQSSIAVLGRFCTNCGTRLPSSNDWDKLVAVPAGLIDDELDVKPEINIHIDSAVNWHVVEESMTSIDGQGTDQFWKEHMEKKDRDT